MNSVENIGKTHYICKKKQQSEQKNFSIHYNIAEKYIIFTQKIGAMFAVTV